MWRPDDEILADLNSKDPARLSAGLRDLEELMNEASGFPLPPLSVEILQPFGEAPPQAVQMSLKELLSSYRDFSPPLSLDERHEALLTLLLRYGDRQVAFQTALALKTAPDPASAVSRILAGIPRHGLGTPRAIAGAQYLVSDLLDGKQGVRQETLRALLRWPREPPYQEVCAYIRPQLEEAEAAALDAAA